MLLPLNSSQSLEQVSFRTATRFLLQNSVHMGVSWSGSRQCFESPHHYRYRYISHMTTWPTPLFVQPKSASRYNTITLRTCTSFSREKPVYKEGAVSLARSFAFIRFFWYSFQYGWKFLLATFICRFSGCVVLYDSYTTVTQLMSVPHEMS